MAPKRPAAEVLIGSPHRRFRTAHTLWQRFWDGLLHTMCFTAAATGPHRAVASARRRQMFEANVGASMSSPFASSWEQNLDLWLRYCSWSVCPTCGVKTKQHITPTALKNPGNAARKLNQPCTDCSSATAKCFLV